MMLTVTKKFTFEASHVLPKHPGKCSRLHGHSWQLGVSVTGPVVEETGFVVDYATLGEVVKAHVIDVVDHHHLGFGHLAEYLGMGYQGKGYGAILGKDFYPSSENLVVAFARILSPLIKELGTSEIVSHENGRVIKPASIQLTEVTLDETCTCRATWRPQGK